MIALDQLLDDIKSGKVTEVFACGTAAIVTPIGRFKSEKFDVTVGDGEPGRAHDGDSQSVAGHPAR